MGWESGASAILGECKTDSLARSSTLGEFSVATGQRWDLEEKLSQVRKEFAAQAQMNFCVIVEGTPRPLSPMISEEVYLMGHEALSNAFRHSQAREVEVEIEYATTHLRILVRDDGCGIDPEVLSSGQFRHWGLCDMKARAARMGARLRVLSRAAAGTEVELTVPCRVAYEWGPENESVRWLARFFS